MTNQRPTKDIGIGSLEFNSIRDLQNFVDDGKASMELDEFRQSLIHFKDDGFKPFLILDVNLSQTEFNEFIEKKTQEENRF